jgi:hypothetical protein
MGLISGGYHSFITSSSCSDGGGPLTHSLTPPHAANACPSVRGRHQAARARVHHKPVDYCSCVDYRSFRFHRILKFCYGYFKYTILLSLDVQ